MLSDYGRKTYFPQGIVAQSAEAGQKAYAGNGTAGIALTEKSPLHLSFLTEAVPSFFRRRTCLLCPYGWRFGPEKEMER